jgi:hypothetical protein
MRFIISPYSPTPRQLAAGVDSLAEYLSQDCFTLNEIADRMEITRGTALVLFHKLCTLYGEAARL